METRYWLSIDGGKRRGDKLRVPERGGFIGRDSGCELQLPEPGVSGKHARLEVEPHGVRVTDLESRNGTRVNGQRVESYLLAHGDRLSLGKLHLTLIDRGVTGDESDAADTLVSGASPVDSSERMLQADSAQVTKLRGVSPIVGVALLLALGAGGFFVWQQLSRPEAVKSKRLPVAAVAGDLLSDGSFEQPATLAAWSTEPATSLGLEKSYRHRGDQGLGAELAAGERFRLASPWCSIRQARAMQAVASLRFDSGLVVTSAWELGSATDAELGLELRGGAVESSSDFREFQSSESMLPGFERARLVFFIDAPTGGEFALDDVAITEGSGEADRVESFEEFELHRHGAASASASLVRIDKVAVSELRFFTPAASLALRSELTPTGWSLRPEVRAGAVRFSFVISDTLAGLGLYGLYQPSTSAGAESRGGRRRLAAEAKASGVSGFLAGEGTLLVRLGFEQPVELQSARTSSGWRITTSPLEGPVELQLSFRDERNRAADIADAARRADRGELPGPSLALWAELLEEVPFDAELVVEAEAARGRQLRTGLDQVEEIRSDFARARFFNLPDIYRRDRARAQALRERYAGSEVETEAAQLEREIEQALGSHVDEEQALESERLARVAEALEASGAEQLAEHVRESADSGGDH